MVIRVSDKKKNYSKVTKLLVKPFDISIHISAFHLASAFVDRYVVVLPYHIFSNRKIQFVIVSVLLNIVHTNFAKDNPFLPDARFFYLPRTFSIC